MSFPPAIRVSPIWPNEAPLIDRGHLVPVPHLRRIHKAKKVGATGAMNLAMKAELVALSTAMILDRWMKAVVRWSDAMLTDVSLR